MEYLVGPRVAIAPWSRCLGFHGVKHISQKKKKKRKKKGLVKVSIALIDVGRAPKFIMTF